MGLAVEPARTASMENIRQIVPRETDRNQSSIFRELLHGHRFSVCEEPADVVRAIDVRRQVYRGVCGYDVPVPDEYDKRSWVLLAEHVRSGRAVGSMRVTPRSAGHLEAEEYFRLPALLRATGVVEVTRFAIPPEPRPSSRFFPAVALGLYKLVCQFTRQLRACSRTTPAGSCAIDGRSWLRSFSSRFSSPAPPRACTSRSTPTASYRRTIPSSRRSTTCTASSVTRTWS